MTRREIRKFRLLQTALDDPVDCQPSVMKHKFRREWLLPIYETNGRVERRVAACTMRTNYGGGVQNFPMILIDPDGPGDKVPLDLARG